MVGSMVKLLTTINIIIDTQNILGIILYMHIIESINMVTFFMVNLNAIKIISHLFFSSQAFLPVTRSMYALVCVVSITQTLDSRKSCMHLRLLISFALFVRVSLSLNGSADTIPMLSYSALLSAYSYTEQRGMTESWIYGQVDFCATARWISMWECFCWKWMLRVYANDAYGLCVLHTIKYTTWVLLACLLCMCTAVCDKACVRSAVVVETKHGQSER